MQALPSRDAATSLGHRRRRSALGRSLVWPFALRTSGGAMDRVGPSLVTRHGLSLGTQLLCFGTSCVLVRRRAASLIGDRRELHCESHAYKTDTRQLTLKPSLPVPSPPLPLPTPPLPHPYPYPYPYSYSYPSPSS